MKFAANDGRGYIDVPSTAALESISGTAFSIAVWVRPRNVTNGNAIVGKMGQYQLYWGGVEGARTLSFSGLRLVVGAVVVSGSGITGQKLATEALMIAFGVVVMCH